MKHDRVRPLISLMEELGFTTAEARLYVASVTHGSAPLSRLAREAGLNRSASYSVFERLKQAGLMNRLTRNGKKLVTTSDPSKLVEKQQERIEDLRSGVKNLQELFDKAHSIPTAKLYEGREGLKHVLERNLKQAKEIRIYGDGDAFAKAIPGWTSNYGERRKKRGIKARLLLKETPRLAGSSTTEILTLPSGFDVRGGFDVYEHTSILYTFENEPSAFVIEHAQIARMMTSVFDMLWHLAKLHNR